MSLVPRVSMYIWLYSGMDASCVSASIEPGGMQVVVKVKMLDFMTDAEVISSAFSDTAEVPYYNKSHTRTVGLSEVLNKEKLNSIEDDVYETYYFPLPFAVEEQFASDLPYGGYIPLSYEGSQILHLEMVGVRSNFRSTKIPTTFHVIGKKRARDESSASFVSESASPCFSAEGANKRRTSNTTGMSRISGDGNEDMYVDDDQQL